MYLVLRWPKVIMRHMTVFVILLYSLFLKVFLTLICLFQSEPCLTWIGWCSCVKKGRKNKTWASHLSVYVRGPCIPEKLSDLTNVKQLSSPLSGTAVYLDPVQSGFTAIFVLPYLGIWKSVKIQIFLRFVLSLSINKSIENQSYHMDIGFTFHVN